MYSIFQEKMYVLRVKKYGKLSIIIVHHLIIKVL